MLVLCRFIMHINLLNYCKISTRGYIDCLKESSLYLKDGTLWLNIGDSYTSGGHKWRDPDSKNSARAMSVCPDTPEGLKPKDLIVVPWRLAFELQSRGWYLRSDIIWEKQTVSLKV